MNTFSKIRSQKLGPKSDAQCRKGCWVFCVEKSGVYTREKLYHNCYMKKSERRFWKAAANKSKSSPRHLP
jgi:hypothetical protein